MVDNILDYKKFYTNVRIFAKVIIQNQDRVENKKKEKEFDNPFVSDSYNIHTFEYIY